MTKIIIHTEEFKALSEKQFFILKAQATEKIRLILLELNKLMLEAKDVVKDPEINKFYLRQGKISRGENYLGLPYMVLDYPGYFKPESVFNFRCKFWWGNYFSFYWIISGELFNENKDKIDLNNLIDQGFMISVNKDLWDHRFENPYFVPIEEFISSGKKITDLPFLKIGKQIDLNEWETLPEQAFDAYSKILNETIVPAFKNL